MEGKEEVIIQLFNLTKRYGSELVWEDINLSLYPSKIIGLIGANGSGKTTLFKTILNLVSPNEGTIETSLTNENDIGFLLEIPLFDYLTAYENVKIIGLYNHIEYSKAEINSALLNVGLQSSANKKVATFSFGMKQRLRLALAIIKPSKLLILDEPLLGLDPDGIVDFLRLIKTISIEHQTAVIISTHQLTEVSQLFDDYYFLKHNKLHLGDKNAFYYSITISKQVDLASLRLLLKEFTEINFQGNIIHIPNLNDFMTITHLLIENDIATIAINKLTTIQGEVF